MHNRSSLPIYSSSLEKLIEEELRKINIIYSAFFCYCIATGQKATDAFNTKVGNVLGQDTITINNFSRTCKNYSVPLDNHTKHLINLISVDKNSSDYLFPSSLDSSMPLPRTSFMAGLRMAMEQALGSNYDHYCISLSSLRKTHFYHIYQNTHNIYDVMKLSGHQSPGLTYTYLGINPAYSLSTNFPSNSARSILLNDDYGLKLLNEIRGNLDKLEMQIKASENPNFFYIDTLHTLQETYNKLISINFPNET